MSNLSNEKKHPAYLTSANTSSLSALSMKTPTNKTNKRNVEGAQINNKLIQSKMKSGYDV